MTPSHALRRAVTAAAAGLHVLHVSFEQRQAHRAFEAAINDLGAHFNAGLRVIVRSPDAPPGSVTFVWNDCPTHCLLGSRFNRVFREPGFRPVGLFRELLEAVTLPDHR